MFNIILLITETNLLMFNTDKCKRNNENLIK